MPARLPTLMYVLVLAGLASAQEFIPTTDIPCDVASGVVQNPTDVTASVWTAPVVLPGATSFRLRFGSVRLRDPRDTVVVTGVRDGQTQRLDQAALRRWEGMTGWFNGDAVVVGLDLAPGSTGSVQVVAAEAFIGGPAFPEAVCDTDTRFPGGSSKIFRLLVPVSGGVRICTGFLVSDRSTYVSAGRCYRGAPVPNSTAEFLVPNSVPLSALVGVGAINHPPIENQFPGDPTTVLSEDDGAGEDWAVGRLHPNNLGQTADSRFGHFQIPPFTSTISTDVRISGYGTANISQSQLNHTLRSDTGPITWIAITGTAATNSISHLIDTDSGNQGSPLVDVNLGFPLGIHVHDDCSSFQAFNQATSIYNAHLLAAIATTNGCAAIHLLDDQSSTVPCSPTVYDCDTEGGRWNVAAVSSTSGWSISREAVGSTLAGANCNFLLSNGHLGDVPGISGEIRRISGTATARAQFMTALPIPLDRTVISSWSSTRIVRAFEFTAAGPSGPSLSVNVSGDPSLSWHLYGPQNLGGSSWFPRGANLVASGVVGGPPLLGLTSALQGDYCLVVFRNGGAATPATTALTVTVATLPFHFLTLPAGGQAPVAAGATTFSVAPAAGAWNAVALAASDDWTLSLGSGVSSSSLATATEFVVANGAAGAITPTQGIASSPAGAAPATLEHATPAGAITAGTVTSSTLPAGHILKLMTVAVVGIGGGHEITVTGDPSLRWFLFDGRAAVGPRWRGRVEDLASGIVGGAPVIATVPPGIHALVVTRDGGFAPADLPFTVRVDGTTAHVTIPGPGTFVGNLTLPDYGFTCTPPAGRWTAVGAASSVLSSHALFIGSASASAPPGTSNYIVANGRLGPVAPVDGIVTRSSSVNLVPGAIYQASASTMNVGSPGTTGWASTILVHLFEFQVTTAATYDLGVSGAGVADWALFRPGTAGVWRAKSQGEFLSAVGTVRTGITLQPGPHAIAVTLGAGGTAGSPITCTVTLNGNLPPNLISVTPGSVIAGSPSVTLLLTASGLVPGATIEWDGSIPLLLLNAGGIVAVTLPASLIAAPGSHTLRAVNPAPGGGPSAALPFVVRAPRIDAVSPANLPLFTPGAPPVQLTISGADFLPGAVIHAGERVLPTTFVSSGQLRAQIDGAVAELNVPGGVGITVENAHRAQSNTAAVPVGPPGSNRGTNVRYPLEPFPGEAYAGVLEGGPPGGLFTFLADFDSPAPVTSWPSAAVNLVLGIGSPQTIALLDGFGLFGPPNPGAVYAAAGGAAPAGTFTLPGFVWPQAPLNVRLSVQTVNLDPSQPLGFGLGWTRIEDL